LLGAEYATYSGRSGSGAAYVVFGQASAGTVDLASLGTKGYVIGGAAANDDAGVSVGNAGDVNGDGIPDALVGANWASNNGRGYVVFGKATTTTVDLASLGAQGYRIDGPSGANLAWGRNAGDLNGDGIPDAIVGGDYYSYNGRTNAGSAWVVFGKASTTTVDLNSLGTGGFGHDRDGA